MTPISSWGAPGVRGYFANCISLTGDQRVLTHCVRLLLAGCLGKSFPSGALFQNLVFDLPGHIHWTFLWAQRCLDSLVIFLVLDFSMYDGSNKSVCLCNTAFLVYRTRKDILFPKSKALRYDLPSFQVWSPQCPWVIPEICISISLPWRTIQGHLAPLSFKLKLHYLSHKPFSLWSHRLSLHSVLGILNTPSALNLFCICALVYSGQLC